MSEWIKVEDGLPHKSDDVLVYESGDDVNWFIATNYMITNNLWADNYDVSHWMPLPAPPE